MLQILVQLILTFFICLESGLIFSTLLQVQFKNPAKIIFTGLVFIAIMGRLWHFFLPLNQVFLLVLLLSSLGGLVILRERQKPVFRNLQTLIVAKKEIFFFLLFFLLYFSSLTSISYDDGLYHAGYIRWLNAYPEIAGLANIHGRFAFNSNWHLLSAVFNGYNIFPSSANSINAFFLFVFVLYFLWEEANSTKNLGGYPILFLFFPLILIYHLIDPSADLVVGLFTFCFLIELFTGLSNAKKIDQSSPLFWLFIFSFLITVKINAVVIAPLFIYFMYEVYKTNKRFYKINSFRILLVAMMLMVPWIISNIMMSGYFVYPYFKADFMHQVWTVPKEAAALELKGINYTPIVRWAHITYDQADKLNKVELFILWLKSVRIVEKLILLIFVFSVPILLWKVRNKKRELYISSLISFTLAVEALLVPDIRFFFGVGFALISILIFLYQDISHFLSKRLILLSVLMIEFGSTIYLYIHLSPKTFGADREIAFENLIYKGNYSYPVYERSLFNNNIVLLHPKDSEFCWDQIPCILKENKNLRMIGESIVDGFYQVK